VTRWPVRRRAVVQLRDGHAIAGILWAQRGPLLILRAATLHEPGTDAPSPMDGDVLVERSNVLWLQLLEGGG
jgi:hypothetical protein